jgi:hypothetical protein
MRAAAQVYNAMGSIAESWLDIEGGEAARSAIERSVSELETAQSHFADGLETIDALFAYLQGNWDEEYEVQLRATGFRGSLFILRDYKLHLETLRLLIAPHIEYNRRALRQLSDSGEATPFRLVVQPSTRAICARLMDFLQFEDDMSQTQMVYISQYAEADHFPS